MGCHVMDGAFWGLKLAEAERFTVEADSAGGTAESYPLKSTVKYSFPARGDMPPVVLNWYDGGRQPERPEGFPDTREFLGSNGTIFVGGKIESLGVDAVDGQMSELDIAWLSRKLHVYGLEPPSGLAGMRKIVAGKQLWNYDNLEPAEKKLVL